MNFTSRSLFARLMSRYCFVTEYRQRIFRGLINWVEIVSHSFSAFYQQRRKLRIALFNPTVRMASRRR